MNWLILAARLWAEYYNYEKKARELRQLKCTVMGAGLSLISFLLGFCSLGLFLLSSFLFFLEKPRFSLAALWTALLCSALTLVVGYFGNRVFSCSKEN